jgi:NADH-quinone oxidoreductase subunit M
MTFLESIPLLTLIALLPLAGMVVVLFLRDDRQIKRFAVAWSLLPLLLSILLWFGYDRGTGGFQFEELASSPHC